MPRTLKTIDGLPHALYRAAQVRELDRVTIEEYGIPGRELMERAGAAAFALLRERWPAAREVAVVCGIGNNGGDGYVVARLAHQAGLAVRVLQLGDAHRIQGDALGVLQALEASGVAIEPFEGVPRTAGVIVDGVFGTGLEREVTGAWRAALEAVNAHPAPVLALDIPSGLHSDTGRTMGVAVRAAATATFIGLKRGCFTGDGPGLCGEVRFDGLGAPAAIYARELLSARRIDWAHQAMHLPPRPRTAHKGAFGHVLVIGGDRGYGGAARLAGEAAARAGAGLVTIATHPAHAPFLNLDRPELMCRGVESADDLAPLFERATVIALGPGLGRSDWSHRLYEAALGAGRPLVVDADGLNRLAERPEGREGWVLTPHPGEAARLLGCSTADIHADRFAAAAELQARYGGVLLLKGAGTVIQGPGRRPPSVCSDGNPGMASGGMGDALTGVIAALVAQGLDATTAAEAGCCLHAQAADRAAVEGGERGLLAGDLMPWIRRLSNLEAGR